jgi:hypothetical protein
MFKRLLIIAAAVSAMFPVPASAATGYMLNFTNYSPYYRYAVAGPFDTYSECAAVRAQQTYVSGGMYTCDVYFY